MDLPCDNQSDSALAGSPRQGLPRGPALQLMNARDLAELQADTGPHRIGEFLRPGDGSTANASQLRTGRCSSADGKGSDLRRWRNTPDSPSASGTSLHGTLAEAEVSTIGLAIQQSLRPAGWCFPGPHRRAIPGKRP